ncbi:uncharacterized protein LOC115230677 [Octopus sinensis]|uniref:Uncharacterized protein LOC115230677 n=1 Tax=Octopus sinensis TaxID=2607531 RepID=A0A6P7U574_9MOLL|nr:uncharacterized protein LOC115230677 [Octopus sinensis]
MVRGEPTTIQAALFALGINLKMEKHSEYHRQSILLYLEKGKKPVETGRMIFVVYGKDAFMERDCQKWFTRLQSGNFSVQDTLHSGRAAEINCDEMESVDARMLVDISQISKLSVEKIIWLRQHIRCLGDASIE